MRLGWIGHVAFVAVLGVVSDRASARDAALPKPIITQRATFSIPFTVPPAAAHRHIPAQVALSVSRDLGTNWEPYSQTPPEQGHFVFQAHSDGEYWFTIQTRDRAGNLLPEFTGAPGLRVRVDTTPPQVSVSAWRRQGGAMTARWRVVDANFGPQGLSLAYRPTGQAQWQDIALDRHQQSQSGDTHLGEVTWWPGQDVYAVEIRLEATDAAMNRSTATTRVETESSAPLTSHPSVTDDRPFPRSPQESRPPTGTVGQSWPAQPHPQLAGAYTPQYPSQLDAASARSPEDPSVRHRLSGSQVVARPPGLERMRAVNSRLFELEFDAGVSPPATIAHVELWATLDGGRTWRSLSLHQGGHSPILAKVDTEGVYGFRIVVHGDGAEGRLPQPGDPPDIWIRVDLTKPVARILSTEEGVGPEANRLLIAWTAADEQLAENPISLAYSRQRGGPWINIARQLPNTGRYAWPMPEGVKGPLYLRLEARDAAGNTAEFETAESVLADRSPPRAFIREVRPLDSASQGTVPRRYIFR